MVAIDFMACIDFFAVRWRWIIKIAISFLAEIELIIDYSSKVR